MKKIVTLGITLSDDHRRRLAQLGELKECEAPTSVDDFLGKTQAADVIYSNGSYLLDSLSRLEHVFVTYPYVELGVFDSQELEKRGVYVANAQGGNRDSIVEWVMFMVLALFRKLLPLVRVTENVAVELQQSLQGKQVLIVGHGSIGTQIGILCQAFGMQVSFFNRGDDLAKATPGIDLVINALNCNTTSNNLLNEHFFMSLTPGSYYITFARPYTYDIDGLIKALDAGVVAGAAIDCDPEKFGDTTNAFYQKALAHPKILVTPHIAFSTKQAVANGAEIAVQNIEAYVQGAPKNILHKQ